MKRIILLILAIALLLSGCNAWMDGEYHSVKPHVTEGYQLSDDVVTVAGYGELQAALVEMVTSGRQQSTFHTTTISQDSVNQYMDLAITHVFQNTAVGAYALDEIHYESGVSGDICVIAVEATYHHGRQEILRIKNVDSIGGVKNIITAALRNCESSVVIKVQEYDALDVEAFVQEYVNENPNLCMELPQVSVAVYPEQGSERILEVFFTYQNSRDSLRNMQDMVFPIFSAAKLYVQNSDSDAQKYDQLYAFLMERFDYKIETSITPIYSLLCYGVGDSKAIAMAYQVMCKSADLPCRVVAGTKNGEAYYWNLIQMEETDYHVDLLECSKMGEFTVMLPEEMTGYVWDYSIYP